MWNKVYVSFLESIENSLLPNNEKRWEISNIFLSKASGVNAEQCVFVERTMMTVDVCFIYMFDLVSAGILYPQLLPSVLCR